MLVIPDQEIPQVLNMHALMDTLEKAFLEYSSGGTNTPLRIHMDLQKGTGTALIMPSWWETEKSLGVKSVTVYPENPKKQLPAIQGGMLLFDGESGVPIALIGASELTKFRTGASSGVATRYFAPKNAVEGAIIGTGGQALAQLKAMIAAVPTLEKINLHNRTLDKTKRFKEKAQELFPAVEFRVMESSARAIRDAQIITTCTNSMTPVIQFKDIGDKKVHINAVGAFKPPMQELDSEIILAADKIIVDNKEGALHESGDLRIPLEDEEMEFSEYDIDGEIGQVISGGVSGRKGEDGLTFYESVGMGCLDVATALLIYQKAQEKGVGTYVDF